MRRSIARKNRRTGDEYEKVIFRSSHINGFYKNEPSKIDIVLTEKIRYNDVCNVTAAFLMQTGE